jgi:hypothetical protein
MWAVGVSPPAPSRGPDRRARHWRKSIGISRSHTHGPREHSMSGWLTSLSASAASALETAAQSDTFAFIKDAGAKVAATVEEKAESAWSTTTTIAEKQLHHASIALLHSEIAEKKRALDQDNWHELKKIHRLTSMMAAVACCRHPLLCSQASSANGHGAP